MIEFSNINPCLTTKSSGVILTSIYSKSKIHPLILFLEIGLPDTFNSWYLVAELHVW